MEWVSLALEDLILNNSQDDHPKWQPSQSAIELAVHSSGFASAIRDTYFPD